MGRGVGGEYNILVSSLSSINSLGMVSDFLVSTVLSISDICEMYLREMFLIYRTNMLY